MGRRRKSGFDFDFIQKGTNRRKKEKKKGRKSNARKKGVKEQ